MTEEHQIILTVWSTSAVSVLLCYFLYRIARIHWRRWHGVWRAFWERGYHSKFADRVTSWARAHPMVLQIAGCSTGIILSIGCMVLPGFGARGFFEVFRIPYSSHVYFKLLGPQLLGPMFLLAVGVPLLVFAIRRKRIPWIFGVFGLIGAYFTAWTAGGVAHDFSHAVFDRCGGIYGTVVSWLCAVIAAAYGLVCVVDPSRRASEHRPQVRPEPPNESCEATGDNVPG